MKHPALVLTLAAVVTVGLLASGGSVVASEQIAENENMVCTTCHDKPGSRLLTDTGKYYELMGSLDGLPEVQASFANCTYCHVRKPGSKKLTRKGKFFSIVVEDMDGLRQWVKGEHPVWPFSPDELTDDPVDRQDPDSKVPAKEEEKKEP